MAWFNLRLYLVVDIGSGGELLTDTQNSERILKSHGYTNIQFTGYSPFSCSEDDWTSTGFVATTPNGYQVQGTVCAGLLFKDATIRFK
ncbi:hypothetical protein POP12_118 [Pectobacterium phage POP12]|nr:hypothetical protein POP12_118 [Pectobacterium phage POP12]